MASSAVNGTNNGRYSTVAMIFHWVIAVAVIVNWRLVDMAESAGSDAAEAAVMANHKALGITILLLTLGRLAWRLMHRPPPMPASYKGWEKLLARTMHVVFYLLLIGLPLGGWLASSYFGGVSRSSACSIGRCFPWPATRNWAKRLSACIMKVGKYC